MSTSKLVKTQLEADEEFNKMLLERENKKWEHDQLHMESQVLNTIQLTRKKQEIITRDEQALAKFQAIKEAKEKARQNLIEQRNKKRHEKLTQVKRERNKNIRIEVKKFRKIQEGFAEYMKARKEKWFSGERDLSQIVLKSQSDLEERDSPKRKRNKSVERPSVPEYKSQIQKDSQFWEKINNGNVEDRSMIDKQIEDLVAEDVRRKEILDKIKEEQSKKIHKVLSKVEDNRMRAKHQHEDKVQDIIQTFVEKQKEGQAARQQLEQERKKLFEKRNEEFKKQLQRNHEVIKSNDAKKMYSMSNQREEIKKRKEKTEQKLSHMRQYHRKLREELQYTQQVRAEKLDQVKDNHEMIMEAWVAQSYKREKWETSCWTRSTRKLKR